MPTKAKKICAVVVVLIIIATTAIPAFALVNQFNFTPDDFTYIPDGYDSWIFYTGNSDNKPRIVFWNSESNSLTSIGTSSSPQFKFSSSALFYVFDNYSDALTYASYNTPECDCSALISSSTTNTKSYFKKNYPILTNNSAAAQMLSDGGIVVDEGYYVYFNNEDTKDYVVCAITKDGSDAPCVILAPANSVSFDSSTKTVNCNSFMYIFEHATVDDCIYFLRSANGKYLTGVSKSTTLSNVASFHYSSVDIVDIYTGKIYFSANEIPDGAGPGGNPDTGDQGGGGRYDDPDDYEGGFKEFVNDCAEFVKGIFEWFEWLPSEFIAVIVSFAGVMATLMIILAAFKAAHG